MCGRSRAAPNRESARRWPANARPSCPAGARKCIGLDRMRDIRVRDARRVLVPDASPAHWRAWPRQASGRILEIAHELRRDEAHLRHQMPRLLAAVFEIAHVIGIEEHDASAPSAPFFVAPKDRTSTPALPCLSAGERRECAQRIGEARAVHMQLQTVRFAQRARSRRFLQGCRPVPTSVACVMLITDWSAR